MLKEFKIYSLGLAKKIMAKGIGIIRVEPNTRKIGMTVFVFEDTEILRGIITELSNEFNNNKRF